LIYTASPEHLRLERTGTHSDLCRWFVADWIFGVPRQSDECGQSEEIRMTFSSSGRRDLNSRAKHKSNPSWNE
jgi:hypothetical protein